MTAPRQITALNCFVRAMALATKGISKAPGTRTTSMSSALTPCEVSPSTQELSNLLVTNLLNFATTIPNRNPVASCEPLRSFISSFLLLQHIHHKLRGRPACPSTARVERPPFHRGGSASKEGRAGRPLVTPFSECAPSYFFSSSDTSHSPHPVESRSRPAQPLSIHTPRCRRSCEDCS